MIAVLIYFHNAQSRHVEAFYWLYLSRHCRGEFPNLRSDHRCVTLIPQVPMPLCIYLHIRQRKESEMAFVDSTALVVCYNRRI